MNETPQSTRQELLQTFKMNGEMTVEALSAQIGITTMGVRQHLAVLEKDGLVSSRTVRQKVGRPALHFQLTERAEAFFPQQYGHFATSILEQIRQLDGDEKIDLILRKRAELQIKAYRQRIEAKPLLEQVTELARIRDDEGYMAEVRDLGDGSFELIEHHCPIADVARMCEKVCTYELEVFRQVLDADVVFSDHKMRGDSQCSYILKKRK